MLTRLWWQALILLALASWGAAVLAHKATRYEQAGRLAQEIRMAEQCEEPSDSLRAEYARLTGAEWHPVNP